MLTVPSCFGQHFVLNLFLSSPSKWHILTYLTEMLMGLPQSSLQKAIAFFLYQSLVTSLSFHSHLSACQECAVFIVSAICFHRWALLFPLFTLCGKVWLHCSVTFHSASLYNKPIFFLFFYYVIICLLVTSWKIMDSARISSHDGNIFIASFSSFQILTVG